MKNLVYMSSEWMYDVDIPLLPSMAKEYRIHYFFFSNPQSPRVKKEEVVNFARSNNIKLHWKDHSLRQLSPLNILSYYALAKEIEALSPFLILRHEPSFYWTIVSKLFMKTETVYFIHDVKVHSGTHNGRIRQFFSDLTILLNKYFILFSNSQYSIFRRRYGEKNCLVTHLSVKEFGMPTISRPSVSGGIKLLFFGRIEYNKGLDILIDGLERLFQKGINNLTLSICGNGSYWNECERHIKTTQNYRIDVRYIANAEIANIFTLHHFLVLPYRDTTQSGPLMIAANYGLPLLAYDHESFREIYNDNNAVFYEDIDKALQKISTMGQQQYDCYANACKDLKILFSGSNISKQIIYYIKNLDNK